MPPTRELLDPHPELRAVTLGVDGEVPNVVRRSSSAGDVGREVGRRGSAYRPRVEPLVDRLFVDVPDLDVRARRRRGERGLVSRVLEELR